MVPYFLLIFVSVIVPGIFYRPVSVVSENVYRTRIQKRTRLTIFLFFFGFFILLALRDLTVGKDLREYNIIFEICANTPFEDLPNLRWELGYTIYNKVISIVSRNYRFFLIVTAIIILIPIYKLYSKERKYGFLVIVLFINMPCFLMIFSGLRQAMAISVGILVYMALENKKYILSVLMVLLAVSFHVSAFVLIMMYPAFFLQVKTKHLLYVGPSIVVIYLLRISLLESVISFLPSHYIEFYGEMQQTGAFGMMILFMIFFVFAFVILDETYMSKRDFFMRNMLLISMVFQFFVPIHGLIQRASYYFLIFIPLSILSVVQAPKKRFKNISNTAIIVMCCFFVLYFFYNGLLSTDNLLDVFPYKFFWSVERW